MEGRLLTAREVAAHPGWRNLALGGARASCGPAQRFFKETGHSLPRLRPDAFASVLRAFFRDEGLAD